MGEAESDEAEVGVGLPLSPVPDVDGVLHADVHADGLAARREGEGVFGGRGPVVAEEGEGEAGGRGGGEAAVRPARVAVLELGGGGGHGDAAQVEERPLRPVAPVGRVAAILAPVPRAYPG